MKPKTIMRLGVRRLSFLLLISLALVFLGSEGAYLFQKEAYDREPQIVELVIPDGTAQEIAQGQSVGAIPEEMTFVIGDTLLVRNLDAVAHEFGPLLIPAGSSASLVLDRPERYAYSCSFRSSGYFGLDVKRPTTLRTRFVALLLAAPATAVFLFVYSLILWPLKPHQVIASQSVPEAATPHGQSEIRPAARQPSTGE